MGSRQLLMVSSSLTLISLVIFKRLTQYWKKHLTAHLKLLKAIASITNQKTSSSRAAATTEALNFVEARVSHARWAYSSTEECTPLASRSLVGTKSPFMGCGQSTLGRTRLFGERYEPGRVILLNQCYIWSVPLKPPRKNVT